MATLMNKCTARSDAQIDGLKIAAGVWTLGVGLIGAASLTSTRPARAVPAFAQQTGHPCKSCHVGGFGPELTPHGREFKLSGYTMREMEDHGSLEDHNSMQEPRPAQHQESMQNHGSMPSQPSAQAEMQRHLQGQAAQGRTSAQGQMAMPGRSPMQCQSPVQTTSPSSGQSKAFAQGQSSIKGQMSMKGGSSAQNQKQGQMQGQPSSQSQKPMPGDMSMPNRSSPQGQSTQGEASVQGETSKQGHMSMPGPSSMQCRTSMQDHRPKGPPIPLAAMAITSFTHTAKDQVPPPEHLGRNNNLVLDQVSIFLAGGVGDHFGGFAQVTYDGIARHLAWDNIDLRAVTQGHVLSEDDTFGFSLNNNPTVQDAWNTLPAWSFPFTDTAVSPTPSAAPLIDGALAQNVVGLTGYGWIEHKFYVEVGGYSSPSSGLLRALGVDPKDPGSIHGLAPYARTAFQTQLAGGTFEIGANLLKAAIFPARDRSSGFTDRYTDWGLDSSWQKAIGESDIVSANIRYEHERADLRASCALGLIGDGTDLGCARYHLNDLRGAVRYTLHDKVGLTISPFEITGSGNANVFKNGSPTSSGLMGEVDYTFWPDSNGPLGPLFNMRVGAQYTAYRKFDGRTSNASNNNALRLFAWIAF